MTTWPVSLWVKTATPLADFAPLAASVEADVCIVGGGYCGLSTALHLAEEGKTSVLLEAEQPGWGASGRNGGQVIPGLKYDPDELVARFGPVQGERLVEFVGNAPSLLFSIVSRLAIDCDAQSGGWIQPAASRPGMETIRRRTGQWQRRGADVRLLDAEEIGDLLGSRHYCGGGLDRRGGSVHPLSFARGLARAATGLGARIFGSSPALAIERDGEGYRIKTSGGVVRARSVVLATNAYTDALWPKLARTVIPVHSFQVATYPLPADVAAKILPHGHCASDTRRLLWYFRKDRDGRLLMGGRGRPVVQPGEGDTRILQAALRDVYPEIGDVRFEYHWGGKVAMTADHLPHLHQLERTVFAGLGFNGRGVAMATAMGKVLAQAVIRGSVDDLAFPAAPPKPVPLHALNAVAVNLLAARYRRQDRKERDSHPL